MSNETIFSKKLLAWFDIYGRHHLPWQSEKTPYHVWLSEIMLQQTQVKTVIPYFNLFVEKFPNIEVLAKAPLDDVLTMWKGLGYYARARNLHKTAKKVSENWQGRFPIKLNELVSLPGIGRSTACAILSIAHNQPTAILDGNVKRVLTRYKHIFGYPGEKKIENQLWLLADKLMSKTRCDDYTQAIMDLGATICKRTNPNCSECPLKESCLAKSKSSQSLLPTRKQRKPLPTKNTRLFIVENEHQKILLEKRPNKGIWGGLWSLPGDNSELFPAVPSYFVTKNRVAMPSFKHTFTHFHLEIEILACKHEKMTLRQDQQFFTLDEAKALALPKPISKIIDNKLNQYQHA